MRKEIVLPLAALALAAAGCQADEQAVPPGASLDKPAAVKEAPLVDTVPAQGLGSPVPAADTLQDVRVDTTR